MAEEKKQFTVLLVEDSPAIAMAMGDALKHEDYNVLMAADGAQGCSLALAHHPDLIITDVRMPVMGGVEMVKEIRKDVPWGRDVEVVFVTNILDEKMLQETVTGGNNSYILKGDTSISNVIVRVDSLLNKNIIALAQRDAGIAEARAEGRTA